jgi:hypothetical protein
MKTRKHLSASGLFRLGRNGLKKVTDHRTENITISMTDALMSGFAIFSLKDSSLLAFDKRRTNERELGCGNCWSGDSSLKMLRRTNFYDRSRTCSKAADQGSCCPGAIRGL